MKIHTIDTIDELRAIVPEWETLTACAVEQNINYQPIPLISVLSNLSFEGWFVVCVWRDESLCGFFPMQADKAFPLRVERMSTLFRNHFMSSIPLVHQDYVEEALSAFWAWFNATPRMLHILELLPNSELGQRFLSTARFASVNIEQSFGTTRAIAPLAVHGDIDCEFDQYLKSIMSAKSQSTYRRKFRKIQQMGSWRVEFSETDDDRLGEQLDNLVLVESKSWKRDAGSAIAMNSGLQQYIAQTTRYAAQNHRLLLVMAYIDDNPVAGMFGFINDGTLVNLQTRI